MAIKKQEAPKGVFVKFMGIVLPLKVISEKVIELKRGNKVVGHEVEKFDKPFAVLVDPENFATAAGGGIRGIEGTLDDLGDCALIVDGKVHALTLVEGLTGTEGAVKTKGPNKGQLRERHAKVDLGPDGLLVDWNGEMHRLTFGASQTDTNSLFVWSSLRPLVEKKSDTRKVRDLRSIASLADMAAALNG